MPPYGCECVCMCDRIIYLLRITRYRCKEAAKFDRILHIRRVHMRLHSHGTNMHNHTERRRRRRVYDYFANIFCPLRLSLSVRLICFGFLLFSMYIYIYNIIFLLVLLEMLLCIRKYRNCYYYSVFVAAMCTCVFRDYYSQYRFPISLRICLEVWFCIRYILDLILEYFVYIYIYVEHNIE